MLQNSEKNNRYPFRSFIAGGMLASVALTGGSAPAEVHAAPNHTSIAPEAPALPLTPPEVLSISESLSSVWNNIISKRSGMVDIAVYDSRTAQFAHASNTAERIKTASIVKLSILERLLMIDPEWVAQNESFIKPMMTQSDNDVASALWDKIGGANGAQGLFNEIGAAGTVAGSGGYWGSTLTTAADQIKIVNTAVYPNSLLSAEKTATAKRLMQQVIPGQHWGVSGGVPADVMVELKNGWYPNEPGWTINSIGHINGHGADYTIAILTAHNPDMAYGIETAETLAAATWQIMEQK